MVYGLICLSAISTVYPPGYVATTAAFSFAAGAAVGAAWGYAWGNANWHGGYHDIDVNKNININNTIDRSRNQNQHQGKGQINQSGKGTWQHDASHRGGVAYRRSGELHRSITGEHLPMLQSPARLTEARPARVHHQQSPGRQTGSDESWRTAECFRRCGQRRRCEEGELTAGRQAATAWHLHSLCREAGILVVSAVQAWTR